MRSRQGSPWAPCSPPTHTHIKERSPAEQGGAVPAAKGPPPLMWTRPLRPPSCPGPENPAWSSFPGPTLTGHLASFTHTLPSSGLLLPSLPLPFSARAHPLHRPSSPAPHLRVCVPRLTSPLSRAQLPTAFAYFAIGLS